MRSVLVVDDTPVGIRAARSAGAFAIGVSETGNELGLALDAVAKLTRTELDRRLSDVACRLYDAGADLVIRPVAESPEIVGG